MSKNDDELKNLSRNEMIDQAYDILFDIADDFRIAVDRAAKLFESDDKYDLELSDEIEECLSLTSGRIFNLLHERKIKENTSTN